MRIYPPCIITPRLLAGVKIGDAFVSIEYARVNNQGRTIYRYYIDLPGGAEHVGEDLASGCGGGTLQDGLASLMCFLSACAESLAYRDRAGRLGENADAFPVQLHEWIRANSDEFGNIEDELELPKNTLIEE